MIVLPETFTRVAPTGIVTLAAGPDRRDLAVLHDHHRIRDRRGPGAVDEASADKREVRRGGSVLRENGNNKQKAEKESMSPRA